MWPQGLNLKGISPRQQIGPIKVFFLYLYFEFYIFLKKISRVRYPFLLEIIFNLGFLSSCFTKLIKRTYMLKGNCLDLSGVEYNFFR